jgi:alpha/beta superfamily hydrolase
VTSIRFSTEDHVSLEGDLRLPQGEPVAGAVVCHAHPRHGGSRDHPILWAIRADLSARGFVVLGFDFRGVMRSGGAYGAGRTETRDVAAAIDRVCQDTSGAILVCGWSFGALVALREAIRDERVAALALIGLPLDPRDIDIADVPSPAELATFRRPVLLLAGEGDIYAPSPRLETLAKHLPAAEVVVLPGTDHFLWRREKDAAGAVGRFAVTALGVGSDVVVGEVAPAQVVVEDHEPHGQRHRDEERRGAVHPHREEQPRQDEQDGELGDLEGEPPGHRA